RYGKQLGIKESPWTKEIAKIVAHDYAVVYPELRKNIDRVIEQLKEEEAKFEKTLSEKGPEIEKTIKNLLLWLDNETSASVAPSPAKEYKVNRDRQEVYREFGKKLFFFYQTFGYPLELALEDFEKQTHLTDFLKDEVTKSFNEDLKQHQNLSRTASAGMFKGGLADASEATIKYHTAAHLLLAALRKVLGEQVIQKGSNITAERLRFDFAHKEKMADEEKQKIEDLVNQAIKDNLAVTYEEMTLDQARTKGAHGIFDAKYGEKVRIYIIGNINNYFSKEICGGPHVQQTGNLGHFKIKKEESSSSGVRRIKAILE
ncbi:MAG: alanine--tRNA ligase, partial [bacterium]|nr:alanine--tRNA ligase [bacterium]